MAESRSTPFGQAALPKSKIDEVHIIWIGQLQGCDGDSVSVTAASLPSIEDAVTGAIPGLPKAPLAIPVVVVAA